MGGYSAIMRVKQDAERQAAEAVAKEAAEAAEDEAAEAAEAAANADKAAAAADQGAPVKRPRDDEETVERAAGEAEDSEAKRSKLAVESE